MGPSASSDESLQKILLRAGLFSAQDERFMIYHDLS